MSDENRELFTHALRTQTHEMHEQLDHSPLLSRVSSPGLTLDEYAKIITCMYECFSIVEGKIRKAGGDQLFQDYFYESRLPDLKRDLQTLGLTPTENLSSNAVGETSIAAAVGMIYVLHGSSLGGQFISKKLRGRVPEEALHFYARSSAFVPAWAQFKDKLDSGQNSLSLAQAVAGARLTFETFYQVFSKL